MKSRKHPKAKDSDNLARLLHHISEKSDRPQVIESRIKALLDLTADTKTSSKVAWGTRMATMMPRLEDSLFTAFMAHAFALMTNYVGQSDRFRDGQHQGAVSIRKTVLPGMASPMLKIRHPNSRLIFNMEIAIRR